MAPSSSTYTPPMRDAERYWLERYRCGFRQSSSAVATSRERHRWQRSDRRRNKQPDQNRNDGNDDQQRDERECLSHHTGSHSFRGLVGVYWLVYQPPRRRRWRDGQAHRDVDRIPERSHSGAATNRIQFSLGEFSVIEVRSVVHDLFPSNQA